MATTSEDSKHNYALDACKAIQNLIVLNKAFENVHSDNFCNYETVHVPNVRTAE